MTTSNDYQNFIAGKLHKAPSTGLTTLPTLSDQLFPFQRDIGGWALKKGRAAIFADCGMGKSAMQLTWAHHVPGRVLILTPLAVAAQTVNEALKFSIPNVEQSRGTFSDDSKIVVTNYEMLEHFDLSKFTAVVLDESSILKSYDGKFRNLIIDSFKDFRWKLACSATPAPNDFMELGNHSEFLNVMSRTEMLSMFFVHDGGETQKWRLKGHAEDLFWRWMCSWSVNVRSPSDLGYDNGGFQLPPLNIKQVSITATKTLEGYLFPVQAATLQERIAARRETVEERAAKTAELLATKPTEQWIVWCNLNSEASAICALIPDAVNVEGSDTPEFKSKAMVDFTTGAIRVLVSKSSICGYGMNFQNCHNVAFLGISDSYENFYQSVRRCWRFGQMKEVNVYCVTSDIEGAVVKNIERKEIDAKQMADRMAEHMLNYMRMEIKGQTRETMEYKRDTKTGKDWTMELGDCVEVTRTLEDESVHYSIFSPPFSSLYTYSNSERDMGNCGTHDEFSKHFEFLVKDLFRVLKSGRLVSFHCMNLPTSKSHHGYIGIHDFRGELIRMFQDAGFIYHSEVVIWKDPVVAMQRTKALGLLYKQLRKDSAMSRQGIPDYLVTMRKPGENLEPVTHTHESFPVGVWQNYASPVWMDINPSDTLQFRSARDDKDEKHICPLQLQVIRRAVELWSNPGDVVLSPFGGIGSEGHVSLKMGRRFIGIELKESYWKQACKNLAVAHQETRDMFTVAEDAVEDDCLATSA
jgi:DNA modification methylase